jgi:hypothetical protein
MPDKNSANVMAGMTFTLLGTKLTAGFKKTADEERTFIFQDVTAGNEGMTIADLISDVKKLMGDSKDIPGLSEPDIKAKLEMVPAKSGSPTVDPTAIRIVLQTVYLDIRKTISTGESTIDYAFRLDIVAGGFIPASIKLINVDRLSLAVWNTDNESVKKRLAIAEPPEK